MFADLSCNVMPLEGCELAFASLHEYLSKMGGACVCASYSLGYLLYVQHNGIPKSTWIARLSFELNYFKYLLFEDLSCYQMSQSPLTLLRPSYV
jgi:hypothetical protein